MARPWVGDSRLDLTSTLWGAGGLRGNLSSSVHSIINVNATLEQMREFRLQGNTRVCGNSSATEDVLSRLSQGALTQRELIEYAQGLRSRDQLVRDCSAVDPDTGHVISCLADQVLASLCLLPKLVSFAKLALMPLLAG